MKSSYTFKATTRDTDYVRICRENHQARFLVVRSEGIAPLTFVRLHSQEHYEMRKLLRARGCIYVPPVEPAGGRQGRTWVIFDGDYSKALEPKVVTTVEVY